MNSTTVKRMGRPLKGDQPLTQAQAAKEYRLRQKERQEALGRRVRHLWLTDAELQSVEQFIEQLRAAEPTQNHHQQQ